MCDTIQRVRASIERINDVLHLDAESWAKWNAERKAGLERAAKAHDEAAAANSHAQKVDEQTVGVDRKEVDRAKAAARAKERVMAKTIDLESAGAAIGNELGLLSLDSASWDKWNAEHKGAGKATGKTTGKASEVGIRKKASEPVKAKGTPVHPIETNNPKKRAVPLTAAEKKYLANWAPAQVGANDEPAGGWWPQWVFAGGVPLDMKKTSSQYIVRAEQTVDGRVWDQILSDYTTGVTAQKEKALAAAAQNPKYKPMLDLIQQQAKKKLPVDKDGMVTVYRGLDDVRNVAHGAKGDAKHGPVSSWTTDLTTAEIFAQDRGDNSGVIQTRVPLSVIIGGYFAKGTMAENAYKAQKEITVLGNPKPDKTLKPRRRYTDREVLQHTTVR